MPQPRKRARAALQPPGTFKWKGLALRDLASSSRKRPRTKSTLFTVPMDLECDECGSLIAKGLMLNARKKEVGHYHGRKAWTFRTRCAYCQHKIVMESNLFDSNYAVMAGAEKVEVPAKVESGKMKEFAQRQSGRAIWQNFSVGNSD